MEAARLGAYSIDELLNEIFVLLALSNQSQQKILFLFFVHSWFYVCCEPKQKLIFS